MIFLRTSIGRISLRLKSLKVEPKGEENVYLFLLDLEKGGRKGFLQPSSFKVCKVISLISFAMNIIFIQIN